MAIMHTKLGSYICKCLLILTALSLAQGCKTLAKQNDTGVVVARRAQIRSSTAVVAADLLEVDRGDAALVSLRLGPPLPVARDHDVPDLRRAADGDELAASVGDVEQDVVVIRRHLRPALVVLPVPTIGGTDAPPAVADGGV